MSDTKIMKHEHIRIIRMLLPFVIVQVTLKLLVKLMFSFNRIMGRGINLTTKTLFKSENQNRFFVTKFGSKK